MDSAIVEALQTHHTYASLIQICICNYQVVGLGTFRDSSVAFRRDDGVGMGGSSGPKVVVGGWNIIGTIQREFWSWPCIILILWGILGAATAG